MAYTTENIRNVCLVGHAGAGKTQLTEALLHAGGAIPNPGSVEAGTTVSDSGAREKQLSHSLDPAVCHLDHKGVHVNLLDLPGLRDFSGRALSVLPAVDTAVIVVNAASGVESGTQQMLDVAAQRGLSRMIVVNKIDEEGADLAAVLDQIQTAFGPMCLPINLPAQGATQVVDCFFEPNGAEPDFDTIESAHTKILDQVVEVDEDLMELYLEQGEDIAPEQLHEAFEKALREGHLIPVCFASATTGVGVPELLEIFEQLMPNPQEGNPPPFVNGEGADAAPIELTGSADDHAIAHVFKIDVDPFRGRLAVFRVHQGTIRTGGQLFVGSERKPLKVAHLLKLNGGETEETDQAVAGDICAIPRAEDVSFGSVLHDSHDEDSIHLQEIVLPEPMYGLAIRSVNDSDAQKISDALHVIEAEDPSIKVDHVVALNETVLRGMGDMHLRVVLEDIADTYKVEVETAQPSIQYKETITVPAEGHHRHKKQTGGAGQFGEVYLRVEPLERGAGFEFVDAVVGGVIPSQFIPAVEKGVRQVLEDGAISGHPMQDIRVTVYDGKHHSVDSKEVAFVQAGKKAFVDAVTKAKPIVMEPIVTATIRVPGDCMGDVAGDLSSMGGMVSGSNVAPDGMTEVEGQAPLRELQSYHSRLKSLSGGAGSFTMGFSHYAKVTQEMQQELSQGFTAVGED